MAKDKEKRQINPAAAALKKQKNDALKKGKAQVLAQRNERLAQRNPNRLQRQIDELKEAEEAGKLRPKDKQHLEQLERDLKAVHKARESLGDKVPQFGGRRGGPGQGSQRDFGSSNGSVLGKRSRDWKREDREPSSETDEDVRGIPMPDDHENEPPLPRKPRRPNDASRQRDKPHELPDKPVQAQTTYSSAPQIRNLQKEAISRFVPSAVAARKKLVQGQGRLLEPEEADKLESEGYLRGRQQEGEEIHEQVEEGDEVLREEEERFTRELEMADVDSKGDLASQNSSRLHQAQVEEVDDEG